MVFGISGAYYFWKLGLDPLIFLKILVVIGHVCIYWSKVAEGFSVFNAVLLELYSDLPGANELMHGCLNNLAANEQLNIVNSLKKIFIYFVFTELYFQQSTGQ